MAAKPEGIAETERLLGKLVQVPKRELATVERKRKKRAARRKKQS